MLEFIIEKLGKHYFEYSLFSTSSIDILIAILKENDINGGTIVTSKNAIAVLKMHGRA